MGRGVRPGSVHRAAALAAAATLLSACVSEHPLDRLLGNHVSGDASQARVSGMESRTDALPVAVAHCAEFRRSAQFDRQDGADFVFACVAQK